MKRNVGAVLAVAGTTAEVVRVLRDLADDGVTFLVASHDQQVIALGDVVVRLEDGRRIA